MFGFGSHRYVRLGAIIAGASSFALVAPGYALAEDPPSAVTQYVEMVPTSAGPSADSGNATRPLAPSVKEQVYSSGGSDAAVLETVATSAAAGAPQRDLPRAVREGPAVKSNVEESSPVFAAVSATADAEDVRFLALLVVLVAITIGVLLEALRRPAPAGSLLGTPRRRRSRRSG